MNSEETTLRDQLALERTYLAKERTILAYVRTGLAFIGVALFVYRFMEIARIPKAIVVCVLTLLGMYATFFGMYKITIRRRERKELEKFRKRMVAKK